MVFTSLCYSVYSYKSYLCQRQSTLNDWWKRDKRRESNIRVRRTRSRSQGWMRLWRGGPVLNSILLTKQSIFHTDISDNVTETVKVRRLFLQSFLSHLSLSWWSFPRISTSCSCCHNHGNAICFSLHLHWVTRCRLSVTGTVRERKMEREGESCSLTRDNFYYLILPLAVLAFFLLSANLGTDACLLSYTHKYSKLTWNTIINRHNFDHT